MEKKTILLKAFLIEGEIPKVRSDEKIIISSSYYFEPFEKLGRRAVYYKTCESER